MKFNTGDKVVLRKGLVAEDFYGDVEWVAENGTFLNEEYVTLAPAVAPVKLYLIQGTGVAVTEDMIQGLYTEGGN